MENIRTCVIWVKNIRTYVVAPAWQLLLASSMHQFKDVMPLAQLKDYPPQKTV